MVKNVLSAAPFRRPRQSRLFHPVERPSVAFLALVNDDDVGLFVTTGGFTKDAEELARAQERRKITLINRRRLVDFWIEYNDRIDRDKRRLLPLKPIYFIGD